jgi:hypothetical protein
MNELTPKEKRVLWCVLNQAQDSGLKSLAHLIEEYDIVNTLKAKLCGDEE